MQEQTFSSENNTQEQQVINIQKRKPGRPVKNQSTTKPSDTIQIQSQLEAIHIQESEKDNTDSPDFKTLMSTINELKQQNEKLLHIVETVNITTTKPLITCSDEDINNLYVKYLTDKETTLNNVVVAEVDGRVLITKSYYVIG
jgi:hypothetical protein